MDDCQWADEASVAVLASLLRQGNKNFFFVGCYRDDEMNSDHAFMKMLESTCVAGVKASEVKMNGIDEEALINLISHVLCLSPRLVRQLSRIVYSKTKGNILFFSQLMLSFHRDGLLQVDLGLQRWIWDEEKIMSVKLPDNVALCFTNRIRLLPVEVQFALFTLSTFGASAKSEHLHWLEIQLNMAVLEPLKRAACEGLVSNIKGSYTFMHDRIQEASYSLISPQHRSSNHLTFGRCLATMALNSGADDDLFVTVNQINLGGLPAAASDREELFTFASWNLLAGKRAMTMSDFMSAHALFNYAISFLSESHWQRHYSFSLELFELATQTSLANGNLQALSKLSSEVFENARSFEDSLPTHYIVMTSLAYGSKMHQALQCGLDILSQLGEGIPNNPTKAELDRSVHQTQSLIRGIGEDDILNYRVMTDKRKIFALKFLGLLQVIAVTIQQHNPPMIMKMVRASELFENELSYQF
jgi:predicted ATPase